MGEIIAGAIGGPAAAAAVAKHKAQGMEEAAPLADAASLLPGMPGAQDMSSGGLSQGQSQTMAQATPMQQALLSPPSQTPATQPMSDVQQPYDNPYVSDTPKELAQNDRPIEVTGDDWKPKKESILGQIGDFMLMRRGMQPVFRQRTDQANLESAMQGFQKDPETAISRVRKIDPEMAMRLQEQQSRVQANQELAKQRLMARQEAGGKLMGGVLSSLPKDDTAPAVYQKILPKLRGMADYYGYPSDLFSDKYDKDEINAMVSQGITPYQAQRLGQQERSTQSEINYRGERLKDFDAQNAETRRYHQSMEGISQQRVDQAAANAAKTPDKSVSTLQTKYGPMEVVGGKKGRLVGPDGNVHYYLNVNGTWVPVKSVKGE